MVLLSAVPRGTPNTVAMVMPAIITDTACEPFPLSANRCATIDATPKYAPCGKPDKKRASKSIQ